MPVWDDHRERDPLDKIGVDGGYGWADVPIIAVAVVGLIVVVYHIALLLIGAT